MKSYFFSVSASVSFCILHAVKHKRSEKVEMIFSSRRFLQKTNERILLYYENSGWLVFVRFLEEIEDTKKTFRNYLTFRWYLNDLRFNVLASTLFLRHMYTTPKVHVRNMAFLWCYVYSNKISHPLFLVCNIFFFRNFIICAQYQSLLLF